MTDLHTLHDAGVVIPPRTVAHHYADELPEPYEWEPYDFHWKHVVQFVIGVALVYVLTIAFIVIGSARVQ